MDMNHSLPHRETRRLTLLHLTFCEITSLAADIMDCLLKLGQIKINLFYGTISFKSSNIFHNCNYVQSPFVHVYILLLDQQFKGALSHSIFLCYLY